ncbi:MAG: methionine--tRNA ligase [Bacteroidetes bacterium]|nr:methionine--tRNA ligase [Bacteroidota bacterium]
MIQAERILVTAALPYANGPIHLGHLAGAYLPADIYVRYQRLKARDIIFMCGSDEHGVPITITADKEGVRPQVVVDRYHEANKQAFSRFGMSFDNYSRTSLPLHHVTAQEFFKDFHARGILTERKELQFYDGEAKKFLPDRYVEGTCPVCANTEARGDQCEKCGTYLSPQQLVNPRSKISGAVPEVRETSHWYFPLGTYQKRLEAYIHDRDARDGWKENVLNYTRGWFKEGLQDRAVTRDLDWGVPVPLKGYETKVIYVWFDAVLGYISSTREWAQQKGTPDAWRRYWLDKNTKYVAFIGKDNVVFHTIVFPAMLMAWNDAHTEQYVLPDNVPANEFLNFEGQKFSKSRGWGIDVDEFLSRFPADPLRYYLCTSLPEYRDSDFTWKEFQAKNNNELADIFGNFVNRTLAFCARTYAGVLPARESLNERDNAILDLAGRTPVKAGEYMEGYHFRDGVGEVMNLARAANKYFNDSEPWKTSKSDPARCGTTINICTQVVRTLAILMSPVVPAACEHLWGMLGLTGKAAGQSWDSAGMPALPVGHKLGTPAILVAKIEDEAIERELKRLGQAEEAAPIAEAKPATDPPKPTITFDDFRKVDLRVARVVGAERVPKSDKLLKLQIEVGSEKRQIVAGIAQHYAPESLVGKSIIVVYNLQPAKLMGQESQGMLLAASDKTGNLVVLGPAGEIESGSTVK